MTLHFTLTQDDALAFTEQYLRDSKSHQALRARVRWSLPCMFAVMTCYHTWRYGFFPVYPCVFGVSGAAWWLLYPKRFDARIRAHARKQMAESSYAKNLGAYELRLLDEHLQSTSPTGSGTYSWTAVDRVSMDSDYLYIFLSGPLGYPVRIAEIGQDAAQSAHDLVAERIKFSRQ